MSIDSLDTPLRVTWDLSTPEEVAASADALQVAERLVEAQLFYVTLERVPLLHPEFRAVVEKLSSAGCQILVVSQGSRKELSFLDALPNGATLLLEVETFLAAAEVDFPRLEEVCQSIREAGVDFGLSLIPTRQRLNAIGPLIDFCLEQNIPRFKLPNMRINDNFSAGIRDWLVRPEDIERLRQQAVNFPDFRGRLQLDVHDLFIWEILFPDGGVARSEYGGCQAANSLAHVDLNGVVHPCVSWPLPLGSLLESSFYAIWQASGRQAVRSEINSVPPGCKGCRDYSLCFGGCRGLSRLDESLNGRDAMCHGKR